MRGQKNAGTEMREMRGRRGAPNYFHSANHPVPIASDLSRQQRPSPRPFPQPVVTSNLAPKIKSRNPSRGRDGQKFRRGDAANQIGAPLSPLENVFCV